MSPPIEAFPASQLQDRIQATASGKRRKAPVDLADCQLKELVQYDCDVEKRNGRKQIVCDELTRVFRRCADGLTVETTGIDRVGGQ